MLLEPRNDAVFVKPVVARKSSDFAAQLDSIHADGALGFTVFAHHALFHLLLGQVFDGLFRSRRWSVVSLLGKLLDDTIKGFLRPHHIAVLARNCAGPEQCCNQTERVGWRLVVAAHVAAAYKESPTRSLSIRIIRELGGLHRLHDDGKEVLHVARLWSTVSRASSSIVEPTHSSTTDRAKRRHRAKRKHVRTIHTSLAKRGTS